MHYWQREWNLIVIYSSREVKRSTSTHRREGAFPPSSSGTSSSVTDSPVQPTAEPLEIHHRRHATEFDNSSAVRHSLDGPSVVVASPDSSFEADSHKPLSAVQLRHQSSWVSIRDSQDSAPQGRPVLSRQNTSDSRSFGSRSPPAPPAKPLKDEARLSTGSNNPFKNAVTNLKRFSALPRTPSQLSVGTSSHLSHQTRTPSPSHHSPPPPRREPRPKYRDPWPHALDYKEILGGRNALERSMGYAQKINELAQYECGLSDWIVATKYRGIYSLSTRSAEYHTHLIYR